MILVILVFTLLIAYTAFRLSTKSTRKSTPRVAPIDCLAFSSNERNELSHPLDLSSHITKKDFKECCEFAKRSGNRGAARFNDSKCQVYPFMQKHNENFVNVFPLNQHTELASSFNAGKNKYVYLLPCGGEGYPPCEKSELKENDTTGCSTAGDVKLFRTKQNSKQPYNTEYQICQIGRAHV